MGKWGPGNGRVGKVMETLHKSAVYLSFVRQASLHKRFIGSKNMPNQVAYSPYWSPWSESREELWRSGVDWLDRGAVRCDSVTLPFPPLWLTCWVGICCILPAVCLSWFGSAGVGSVFTALLWLVSLPLVIGLA